MLQQSRTGAPRHDFLASSVELANRANRHHIGRAAMLRLLAIAQVQRGREVAVRAASIGP
jgi:hypothetical protein